MLLAPTGELALAELGHPDVASEHTGSRRSFLERDSDRLRIRFHRGLQRKRNLLLHL